MVQRAARAALLGVLLLAGHGKAVSATTRVAGDGHVRIPFVVESGHVWVRGVIAGSDSLWIIVDSGASSSVMDEGLAKALGLEQSGRHETTGAGGAQPSSSVADVTIRIGDLSIHRDSLDTTDLAPISAQSGHPLQIILGFELFESCVVRFDYPAGIMDVWDRAHAPRSLPGVSVPMTLEDNHPYVIGVLTLPRRAPLRGRFVIDTGSSASLIVAPDVAARDSLAHAFPRTLRVVGRGVGGERSNRIGRAESLGLGGLRFERPLVIIPSLAAGQFSAPGTLGNIGGQLLARCRVTFDYRRRRVAFERGPDFDRPFEADMSGMSAVRGASGLTVRFVDPGTPASEAGVRVGDVVTSIDGEAAVGIEPERLRLLMQREGRAVRLEILRGAEVRTVTLVLRRLI